MGEVTNEFLAQMIDTRFNAIIRSNAKEFSDIHHRLDMLQTSVNEIASLRASHEEISVVHGELDRLRQELTVLRADVEVLRPAQLNGNGTD
jgi:hypothetical protein